MNIKEAKKVISNMQIDVNDISCTLCIFEDERKCVENNVDCQMKAIKTVLAELEKKDKIINKMAEQLTTDIHSKEWVIDYYEREVER